MFLLPGYTGCVWGPCVKLHFQHLNYLGFQLLCFLNDCVHSNVLLEYNTVILAAIVQIMLLSQAFCWQHEHHQPQSTGSDAITALTLAPPETETHSDACL